MKKIYLIFKKINVIISSNLKVLLNFYDVKVRENYWLCYISLKSV